MNEIYATSNETTEGFLIKRQQSKNLLVAFGGISHNFQIPVFEFFRLLKDVDCDKIFLRDFSQAWYQNGIDDKINNIDKLISVLQEEISYGCYERICFIGNSMGGYAALLFGHILKVNKIFSFAPQTFIDKWHRLIKRDFRWKKQLRRLYASPNKEKAYFDLQKYFNSSNIEFNSAEIFFSPSHRLDKIHAERLQHLINVHLKPVDRGGHQIVKTLRDNGDLKKLILTTFNE